MSKFRIYSYLFSWWKAPTPKLRSEIKLRKKQINHLKGEIVEKSINQQFYLFVYGNDEVKIPFIALEHKKDFLIGDIITIEVNDKLEFIKLIQKHTNKYFEKLKYFEKNNMIITAYVYAENSGGFLVSYHGYTCFLPISKSTYRANKRIDKRLVSKQILNKKINFEILRTLGNQVYLSRKNTEREEKKAMVITEMKTMSIGYSYLAEIEDIQDYGIFLKNIKSNGLLHISNLLYFVNTKRLIKKTQKEINSLLDEVFKKKDMLFVEIYLKKENTYSLIWDIENENNNKYWRKIVNLILKDKKYEKLRKIYYPIEDIIKEVEIGQKFTGIIDECTNFGIFINIKNLTGLLHISEILTEEELSNNKKLLEQKYKEGELINVEILNIKDNKIFLKLPE